MVFNPLGLGKEALTALPFIRSLVELPEALSANEILRRISDAGMGIRRTVGLDIIRSLRETIATRPYMDALKYNVLPDPNRLTPGTHRLVKNYLYLVEHHGVDTTTGEVGTRWTSVYSTELLTKQEALDIAIEDILYGESLPGFAVERSLVKDVLAAPIGPPRR